TQLRYITPNVYKALTPKEEQPKPVINSGYIEVPNNNDSRGKPRIQATSLSPSLANPSSPYPPVPSTVRNDDSLKVPLSI
ncbi:MAG: hypothetical protein L6N96_02965, partial [Candidatus Methylarchaceae archaeon HK02M2]|nr:hypothetical protein [Candidatus Methylarchaceae archaeon HK02M2]